MNRLLKPRRENEAAKPLDDVTTSDGGGSSRGGLGKVLLGLGVAGLAYLAARRARRSERAPSMGEVRETVGDVRSGDGFEIPIGETGEETEDESESSEGAGTMEGAIGNEPMPGEDLSSGSSADRDSPDEEGTDRDVPDQDGTAETDPDQELADEAIEERTEEDAHEEPKEPGEMAVDEDVADDVLGEESEGSEESEGTEDSETDEAEGGQAEETDQSETTADTDEDTDSEETDDEESA